MTKVFTLIALLCSISQADSSTSAFYVSGIVPVIVKVSITQSGSTYYIHEVSNDPNGYTITLLTNATSVTYNGQSYQTVEAEAILTQVTSQTKSIDTIKTLVVNPTTTFLGLTIEAN